MNIKYAKLITILVLMLPFVLQGQDILTTENDEIARNDSTVVEKQQYYKTAEIIYEIETVNRYVKDRRKQIESFQNVSEIDSSFSNLSVRINKEFDDFNSFYKPDLSKFFLQNTKRVWLSYRFQLVKWQADLSKRIQNLMQISNQIKEKETKWSTISNQIGEQNIPQQINNRILDAVDKLHALEKQLFEVVGTLSELDSRIIDQLIEVDKYIESIEELHKSYRENLFKSTHPVIWEIHLTDTFEGTVGSRLKKVWYENTKSLRHSILSYLGYFNELILWSFFIIVVVLGLRFLYFRQHPSKRLSQENDITELIIRHPAVVIIYLILFVFSLQFKNLPLALTGLRSLIILICTYFLLRSYISTLGRRLIITFIVLLIINKSEIVFWYFGDYARLYLILEAVTGIVLISQFINWRFKWNIFTGSRYKLVVDLLKYPVFSLYAIGLISNILGYQNLTVLFLNIGTQASYTIIIIIGAWEISRSGVYTLFEVLTRLGKQKPYQYLPLLKKRLSQFFFLFFVLIGFYTFLVIVELDVPFYERLGLFLSTDRHVGSFTFTYGSISQFIIIMLITWGITSIIKIAFDEGNFKRTQRLRGIPAAISITLRLTVAMAGFLLALSGAGIDLTKISIMLGAFSVGIGFGLQNIVNNFISGLILIYERPIQVGDTIEMNTLMGEVRSIGIRSSNVRTFDGAEVVVPNSILVSDQLINWTLSDEKRRIEIVVGVKYGTDPVQVIAILKQVADEHPLVRQDPEPRVLFNEFADSSLNFRLLCWVLFENGIQTKSDLAVAIDKAFKENNIEIPFPQLDLHVKDTPDK
ncbi:mechanosensitive ion channel domain-containing protein [Maribellus mangrovi]|uniref:mechanosensitive ion channel domain-containing protein n=1 Tax=Maribellus mangrovi TaxID=3133146 RepID=UPI0030EE195D